MAGSIFADVHCTSGSLLSGAVTWHGGRAVQCSLWNGFDLTTKAGTEKLKGDLLSVSIKILSHTSEHSRTCFSGLLTRTGARQSGVDVGRVSVVTVCSQS